MPLFEEEIHLERLGWFIRLRWWALGGGALILLGAVYLSPFDLPYAKLLVSLGILALTNLYHTLHWRSLRAKAKDPQELSQDAGGNLHLQMFLDLSLLTVLLYFGGGSQNPLVLLYLFHLAISAILFSKRESLFYAALAAGLPWGLFVLGKAGSLWKDPVASAELERALLLALTLAAVGLWFFLTRLADDLRAKERGMKEAGERLREANEGLLHLDQYKNRFLKNVVARLKKPAMDVDLDLSRLEKALPARNEKAHQEVAAAKKRVWGLLETIEDLAWLSRMKAGEEPLVKEPLEVYETLLKVVQSQEEEAKKKGIEFQLHGDPQVHLPADPKAFAQAAAQILSNAVKYTPPGRGPVRVEFKAEEGWLDLFVEDEGIGIPQQQQKRLFEEFFRATNAKAMDEAGTGLGLPIVKWILEAHKGTVKVVSEPGKGTRVETRWPLQSP